MNLDDYYAELEAKEARKIAAEDAAWIVLPQAEKNKINAEREARMAYFFGSPDENLDEDEDEEDSEDEA